ncbi:MAG: hypothetical protein U0791_00910 [Gemmataceae bacterium]
MTRHRRRWTALAIAVALAVAAWFVFRLERPPTDLESATLAIERRDFDSAREHLKRHLDAHPEDRDALLIAARTARRAGDRDGARSYLARCESAGVAESEIQFERELVAIGMGNALLAKEHIADARRHPESGHAKLSLEAVIEAALNRDDTSRLSP